MEPVGTSSNVIFASNFDRLWESVAGLDSEEVLRLIHCHTKIPNLRKEHLAGFRENVVALLVAIEGREERLTLLQALLGAGLDIERGDSKGCVGFHYFLEKGHELQNIWSDILSDVSLDQLLTKDSLGRNVLHYAAAYCTEEQIDDLLRLFNPQIAWCDEEGIEPFHFSSSREIAYKMLAWRGQGEDRECFWPLLEAGYCPKEFKFSCMSSSDKQHLRQLLESERFVHTLQQLRDWLKESHDVLSEIGDDCLFRWASRVVTNLGRLRIFARYFFESSSDIVKELERMRLDSSWLYSYATEESAVDMERPQCPVLELEERRADMDGRDNTEAFSLAEKFWQGGLCPQLQIEQIQPFRYLIFEKLEDAPAHIHDLLQRGFDVNAVDKDGQTALYHILLKDYQSRRAQGELWEAILARTTPDALLKKGLHEESIIFCAYAVITYTGVSEGLSFFEKLLHRLPKNYSLKDCPYDKSLLEIVEEPVKNVFDEWRRRRDCLSPH